MALTQEQVDWWFSQNPNATADEVAAAVKSVGGLEGNEGLAGMIANRYAIAEPEVTNYYNKYTAPKENAATFSEDITSGTPTTQEELLATLGGGTKNATTKAATENWPSIIYGTTGTEGDVLTRTTTSDGTPFYLRGEEGGEYQNPDTVESYAPFTGADGKTYYHVYAPTFSSGKAWNETPITGTLTEAQFKALQGGSTMGDAVQSILNSPVGSFGLGLLGPYGQVINAANQANQGNLLGAAVSGLGAAQGFGVTDIGGFDIKTVQNVARGLNAIDKNDLMGALTAGSNLIGGIPGDYKTATNLASAALALSNNDTAGFLSAVGDLTGSTDTKTAAAAARLLAAVSADNPNLSAIQAAATGLNSAVSGTKSTTGTTGTTGTTTVGDFEDTEVTRLKGLGYTKDQIQEYFRNLDNLTEVLDTGTTGTAGTTVSGLPTGTQLASTGTGFEVGTISGAPIFAESANASSITAPFGYRLTSASETDEKPAGSFYDPTTNAWFSPDTAVTDLTGSDTIKTDADLFSSSIGDLDKLDNTDRTADDFADFLATLGITNTTQLTDSGLSNQDILDMINAADDTVTVTGKKDGIDTTGTTITGTDGTGLKVDDKGTVTVTGTKESCPVGTVLNPETGECDAVEDKTLVCDAGYHEENGVCVKDTLVCDTGYHEENGVCVKDTLTCPEGYEPNEAGTECIPVVKIVDKKCPPGQVYDEDLKMCVPIKAEESCPTGFHKDASGACVPDVEECPTGYHRDETTGQCVKDALVCAEGFELNEAGTECIPTVKVTACKEGFHRDETGACVPDTVECGPGYHLEDGQCVKDKLECPEGYELNEAGTECIPIVKITACKEGFHRNEEGVCVPDTVECGPGYHLEDGACVKNALECPEGYELNEAGTECIPVVTIESCKEGFHKNAEGVCVPDTEECAEGFHLENGLCVPDDDETCETGFEKVDGKCVPICKEGYIRNLATGACEKEDKPCPPGQVKDANGKCVPITKTVDCQPGYERVGGVCVPIKKVVPPTVPTGYTPSGTAEGERIDPIYAGAMDDFDLFATLEELLADNSDKKDTKKDNKKSKDKTKMATGGHLDDLLAEQMTVDDLLKLLR